jgi:hypothetical protein
MALSAEDAKLVAWAANTNRILPDNALDWVCAMAADPEGTRKSLLSLTPIPKPVMSAAAGVAFGARGVTESLSRMGVDMTPRARPVEAAAAPLPATSAVTGGITESLGQLPGPIPIRRGKPQSEYTRQEQSDEYMRRLGGVFRASVPRAPGSEGVFIPSPNSPYEAVPTEDGGVEFRPKANYKSVVE